MVDDRPSSSVDEQGARLHGRQLIRTEHRTGLVGQRHADLDDVGCRDELIECHRRHWCAISTRREDDIHPERRTELADPLSDPAVPDDTEPLAGHLDTHETLPNRPVSCLDRLVDVHEPPGRSEHQHDRVLCDCGRGHPWRVNHGDTGRAGGDGTLCETSTPPCPHSVIAVTSRLRQERWLNRTADESAFRSWIEISPALVRALKSGARSPSRVDICCRRLEICSTRRSRMCPVRSRPGREGPLIRSDRVSREATPFDCLRRNA